MGDDGVFEVEASRVKVEVLFLSFFTRQNRPPRTPDPTHEVSERSTKLTEKGKTEERTPKNSKEQEKKEQQHNNNERTYRTAVRTIALAPSSSVLIPRSISVSVLELQLFNVPVSWS